MILSGNAIRESILSGDITVDPYDDLMIQPASLDLKLGKQVRSFEVMDHDTWPSCKVERFELDQNGMVLHSGLYLMHTEEIIHTDMFVGILSGKSSIGREFVQIHSTAGYIDPGFRGQLTLEVIVHKPFRFHHLMPICQIHWHELAGPITLYQGKYRGEAAMGAVSAVWNKENGDNA